MDAPQLVPLVEPQNDPDTNVRNFRVTMAGNAAPGRVKRAMLVITNATITSPGTLFVMLGGMCAIPIYINAPAAVTMFLDLTGYMGDEFAVIDDFSLSQPLTGGSIALLTLE